MFLLSIDVKGDKSNRHQRQTSANTNVTVNPVSFPASIQSFLENDWTREESNMSTLALNEEKKDAFPRP